MDEEKQAALFDIGETKPIPPPLELPPEPKVEEPDRTQPMEFSPPLAGATISPCGKYRYTLWRRFKEQRDGEKHLVVCMANPSYADADINDRTVSRVEYFAKREGAAIVTIVNFASFRATKPKDMRAVEDPFGPENTKHIVEAMMKADAIILAWGNLGSFRSSGRLLYFEIVNSALAKKPILCFGKTKLGHPKHPLYLRHDAKLVPFEYSKEKSLADFAASMLEEDF